MQIINSKINGTRGYIVNKKAQTASPLVFAVGSILNTSKEFAGPKLS
jgi:NAD(P)H-nitrite reductase large subunit